MPSEDSSPSEPPCLCGHGFAGHRDSDGSCMTYSCGCMEYRPKGPTGSEPHKHVLKWDDTAFGGPFEGPGWSCVSCDWRFAAFQAKELVEEGRAVMAEPKDTLPQGGAEGVHVHEWGEWEPYNEERRKAARLSPVERASCACGADKLRTAEPEEAPRDFKLTALGERVMSQVRRPPYAVAYAVEGGALYEVAVSGDATVVAEDGALHILHPKKPVLAIARVTPMNMEES